MILKDIEPRRVMYFFEKISQIPRGSGNEKDMSNYLVAFAKVNNLEYYQDDKYNVIIKKEATKGYENSPIVALQGHIDMVCVANKGLQHDFLKDPIDIQVEGDKITANGTSLGADNGIAVAYMLAILESEKIKHPKLEAIFTIDEEVGMTGVSTIDLSKISSDLLINIDSEDEGIITVSCAGGVRVNIDIELDCNEDVDYSKYMLYNLSIKGLKGGHSGTDINLGRKNAIKLLIDLVKEIADEFDEMLILYVNGGEKDNAIPRHADICIMINKNEKERYEKYVKELINKYIDSNIKNEPDIKIIYEKMKVIKLKEKPLSLERTRAVVNILANLHDGVYSMSDDVEGLVQTSSNLGYIKMKENNINIACMIRSSKDDEMDEMISNVRNIAEEYDKVYVAEEGRYPAWEYEKNSDLRKFANKCFIDMYGRTPVIDIIHAGLECAVFKERKPSMDIISIGPDIRNPHSPDEYVDIKSVQRVWEYILYMLKKMK